MFKIVDLFSGAGGLTFGFYYKIRKNSFVRNRQFNFLFANEYNVDAVKAFKLNFKDIPLIEGDISNITEKKLQEENICGDVDLIIGGPPCQSYSTVGKRQYDQRAKMYHEYTRLLSITQPKIFIFENVKGLLSMKNDNGEPVINDIKKLFDDIHNDGSLGYDIVQSVLNAKDFGVPQNRERVFLIGLKKGLNLNWSFPEPTHGIDELLEDYITIENAISDLPNLIPGETSNNYNSNMTTPYISLMRDKSNELFDHSCGIHGAKMTEIMKIVPEGEGKNYINSLVKAGRLKKEYYLTSGYGNTYGRLWWKKPSTTITNSFGSPSSLRCIHPREDRPLTTREGARLQSFPDWFKFHGGKTQKNSQIGNAVPPLMAIHLAKSALKTLKDYKLLEKDNNGR